MDIATLGLRVDSSGYVRAMSDVERSSNRATRSGERAERMAQQLRNTLAAFGGALGLQQIVQYADTWNLIEGRLGLVTSGTRNLGVVQNELFSIANRSRQGFEATSELYAKVARGARGLGASQREMLTVTEAIGQSFIVSSASVQQADSAVRQLGQAFASGTLRGDELNSILENSDRLAQAIATGMGVTTGQLRTLGREGKLTSKQVFDAIHSQAGAIEEEFGRMPTTVGQSVTVLKNEILRFVGAGDNATGASKALADTVLLISRNLGNLFALLSAGGAAWLAYTNAAKLATFWTAAVAAAQTIAAYASLAMQIRTVSDAMTLFGMASKGAVAFLTGPAGIAIALGLAVAGLIAYRQRANEAARANDEFAASLASMSRMQVDVTEADVESRLWEEERKLARLREQRQQFRTILQPDYEQVNPRTGLAPVRQVQVETEAYRQQSQVVRDLFANLAAIERHREALAELDFKPTAITGGTALTTQQQDMVRLAQQAAALARLEGDAQARLAIEYDATNKSIDARRQLQGRALNDTLAAIESQRQSDLAALTRDVNRENEDSVRLARQALEIAQAEGPAQEALALQHQAVNREIEMRRRLRGDLLDETLKAIAAEREAGLAALQGTAATEERRANAERIANAREELDLVRARGTVWRETLDGTIAVEQSTADERVRINLAADRAIEEARKRLGGVLAGLLPGTIEAIEEERRLRLETMATNREREHRREIEERTAAVLNDFRGRVAGTFTELFEGVFTRGLDGFRAFFDAVHRMLARMVAETLTRAVMTRIGNSLAGSLAGVFGGLPGAAAQAPSPTAVTMQGAGATMLQASVNMQNAAAMIAGAPPPSAAPAATGTLPPVSAEAQQSFAATLAQYVGPALAGFAAGSIVGGMTSNRGLGAAGGALSGSASGALMGSAFGPAGALLGAGIGALTGALGGLLGSNRRREEAERRTADLMRQNNERLRDLKLSNDGLLMSGRRLVAGADLAARLQAAIASGALSTSAVGGALGGADAGLLQRAVDQAMGRGGTGALQTLETEFGISMEQLSAIARETGIQLYDSAGRLVPEALGQLAEAIGHTIERMTRIGQSLDDQRLRQEAYNKLFGVADTPQQRLEDSYALLRNAAPDLFRQLGLGNLDLTSQAGRDALSEGFREIFRLIDSGSLTPEMLGSFSDWRALLQAVMGTTDALGAFKTALDGVTTDFPHAMRLLLWEQEHGRGVVPAAPANTRAPVRQAAAGSSVAVASFSGPIHVTITPAPGDSGEAILRKIEDATAERAARGGYTYLPRTVIEA